MIISPVLLTAIFVSTIIVPVSYFSLTPSIRLGLSHFCSLGTQSTGLIQCAVIAFVGHTKAQLRHLQHFSSSTNALFYCFQSHPACRTSGYIVPVLAGNYAGIATGTQCLIEIKSHLHNIYHLMLSRFVLKRYYPGKRRRVSDHPLSVHWHIHLCQRRSHLGHTSLLRGYRRP